jgi:hypothetical protein
MGTQKSLRLTDRFELPHPSLTNPLCLEIHIKDFAILVNSPPQVMLLAVDFHEYFVNVESVTEAPMLSL